MQFLPREIFAFTVTVLADLNHYLTSAFSIYVYICSSKLYIQLNLFQWKLSRSCLQPCITTLLLKKHQFNSTKKQQNQLLQILVKENESLERKRSLRKSRWHRNTGNGLLCLNQNEGSPNQQTPSLRKERFTKQVITHGSSFPTKFTWILETTV